MSIVVICGPTVDPRRIDSAAAEARAYESFRSDFLRRFSDGVVMTQLEYIAKTTFASGPQGPVQYSGKPKISALLRAMSDAFKRGLHPADFRKPDGIGIAEEGMSLRVECLEVTTEKNFRGGAKQMRDKLDTLRTTVDKSMNASGNAIYVGTPWKPSGWEKTLAVPPDSGNRDALRWVCFLPTDRVKPPDGVILYEVHSVRLDPEQAAVPKLSPDAARRLREAYQQALQLNGAGAAQETSWIDKHLQINAPDREQIRALVLVSGIALAAACIVTAIDPVPGDEVVVCGIALQFARTAIASGR